MLSSSPYTGTAMYRPFAALIAIIHHKRMSSASFTVRAYGGVREGTAALRFIGKLFWNNEGCSPLFLILILILGPILGPILAVCISQAYFGSRISDRTNARIERRRNPLIGEADACHVPIKRNIGKFQCDRSTKRINQRISNSSI